MNDIVAASPVRQRTVAKARVLLEALPYLREHRGAIVVVKCGGAVMEDRRLLATLAEDVALLHLVGVRPVVVHGGGPQISAVSERLGLEPRFVRGLRVTDEDTLEVTRMVLVGKLNKDLVRAFTAAGVPAAGLSGDDGGLLVARRLDAVDGVDLGHVGEVVEVRPDVLHTLMERFVPVVASAATDGGSGSLNVNADAAAAALAVAVGARKLVYLTDVPGLYQEADGRAVLLSEVSVDECERLMASGAVSGGMIPKVGSAVRAIRGGVSRVHILDGRVEHALILELFTPEGVGTMVTAAAGGAG